MSRQLLFTEYSREELKRIINECLEDFFRNQVKGGGDQQRLTQKQAAEFLGVTTTTIINWKKAGIIPFHQIKGKIIFFKEELLEATRVDPSIIKAARK